MQSTKLSKLIKLREEMPSHDEEGHLINCISIIHSADTCPFSPEEISCGYCVLYDKQNLNNTVKELE